MLEAGDLVSAVGLDGEAGDGFVEVDPLGVVVHWNRRGPLGDRLAQDVVELLLRFFDEVVHDLRRGLDAVDAGDALAGGGGHPVFELGFADAGQEPVDEHALEGHGQGLRRIGLLPGVGVVGAQLADVLAGHGAGLDCVFGLGVDEALLEEHVGGGLVGGQPDGAGPDAFGAHGDGSGEVPTGGDATGG